MFQWFEEKTAQIESLDNQLRALHAAVETLTNQRRELASCTGATARSIAVLANGEPGASLGRALAQLAETIEKVEVVRKAQSNSDLFQFGELLRDYVALIGAIKVTNSILYSLSLSLQRLINSVYIAAEKFMSFCGNKWENPYLILPNYTRSKFTHAWQFHFQDIFHERVKVFQNCQHAQMMLNKKREQKARLEQAGRNDKTNQAATEVIEWESKVERCQEEFENISKMIKTEISQFELVKVEDFKAQFIEYLEAMLQHQNQLVKYWESFLPEARAVSS